MTWVFDGTLSRSIAAGSGRATAGAGSVGCCCGAGVLVVPVPVAGARRGCVVVRAGIGVVEITSTVGSATGGEEGACARPLPVTPSVVTTAIAVDRNRPLIGTLRPHMTSTPKGPPGPPIPTSHY